jgi:hypothetical protein
MKKLRGCISKITYSNITNGKNIGHSIVGTNNKISNSSIMVNKNTHTLEQRIADLEMIIETQKELIEVLKIIKNNKNAYYKNMYILFRTILFR